MRFSQTAPTATYYLVVMDIVNNVAFDWNSNTWVALGSAVTPGVAMTAETIGLLTTYHADINIATICLDSTPRDIEFIMCAQAGGSPAPATDSQRGKSAARVCCGYEVPSDHARTPFVVDVTCNLTTTAGDAAHLTAELTFNGKTIPLHTLDSGATCAIAVTQDPVTSAGARVAQFAMSTSDIGAANAASRFEGQYVDPNFAANKGFTAVATIVTGGVTYVGSVKFTTF